MSSQFFIQVSHEYAFLNTLAEIQQGGGEPISARIVGYIVTDDVLHGSPSI
jgi:hypothetical protein